MKICYTSHPRYADSYLLMFYDSSPVCILTVHMKCIQSQEKNELCTHLHLLKQIKHNDNMYCFNQGTLLSFKSSLFSLSSWYLVFDVKLETIIWTQVINTCIPTKLVTIKTFTPHAKQHFPPVQEPQSMCTRNVWVSLLWVSLPWSLPSGVY